MTHLFFSSSFIRGFGAGFSAPYTLLFGSPKRFSRKYQDTVAQSWEDVGEMLNEAYIIEGRSIEQKSRKRTV